MRLRLALLAGVVVLAGCPAPPASPAAPAPPPSPPATASPFAGRWTDGTLGVELDAALKGSFFVRSEGYPATGQAGDDRLTGSFLRDGASYPFSATRDGDDLILSCDGKTYTLSPGEFPTAEEPTQTPAVPIAQDRDRDSALVGNWTRARDADAESRITLELREDGSYLYGHTRGGKASGQLVAGRWRSDDDRLLTSRTGEAPWLVFAAYEAGSDRLLLTFEGQDSEVWRRN